MSSLEFPSGPLGGSAVSTMRSLQELEDDDDDATPVALPAPATQATEASPAARTRRVVTTGRKKAAGTQGSVEGNNAASNLVNNLVNKQERKKENNLASLHAKKHVSKKVIGRRLKDCSPDEIATTVEEILGYCDSPDKQVSTRVPAALWAKVKQAAGEDIYNPLDVQDVVVEALKIKLLALKLGITDFDFPNK